MLLAAGNCPLPVTMWLHSDFGRSLQTALLVDILSPVRSGKGSSHPACAVASLRSQMVQVDRQFPHHALTGSHILPSSNPTTYCSVPTNRRL